MPLEKDFSEKCGVFFLLMDTEVPYLCARSQVGFLSMAYQPWDIPDTSATCQRKTWEK